jgi:hypothetical protein
VKKEAAAPPTLDSLVLFWVLGTCLQEDSSPEVEKSTPYAAGIF